MAELLVYTLRINYDILGLVHVDTQEGQYELEGMCSHKTRYLRSKDRSKDIVTSCGMG